MATKPEGELIGYARVSTEDQSLDLQLDALRAAGVHPDHIHVEKVSAGSKRRHKLALAIKALRPGDTLLVWKLDRLARSVQELYERLDEISRAGASFRSVTQHFDFSSSTGKLIVGVLGVVAEFERNLISDRTKAALASLAARGVQLGAKRKLADADIKKAKAMLRLTKIGAKGRKVHKHTRYEVAKELGISVSTLRNYGL